MGWLYWFPKKKTWYISSKSWITKNIYMFVPYQSKGGPLFCPTYQLMRFTWCQIVLAVRSILVGFFKLATQARRGGGGRPAPQDFFLHQTFFLNLNIKNGIINNTCGGNSPERNINFIYILTMHACSIEDRDSDLMA